MGLNAGGGEGWVEMAALIGLGMLVLALGLATVRLARGPSQPDRVIALDLISTIAVGMMAVVGILTDEPVVLDVAIVVALVTFLATVAFARYVERTTFQGGEDGQG